MNPDSVSVTDDIVFSLLILLPVKSLLRFRCVCKRWRSIISDDPSFAEAHQCRSLLISSADTKGTLYFVTPSINEREVHCPFESSHDWNITQSINGLICTYERASSVARVYNLSHREYVNLPPPIFFSPGATFWKHVYSLGFDPSTKTYKILRAWIGFSLTPKYEILTLGSEEWRIIEDGPLGGRGLRLYSKGICPNGTIYCTDHSGLLIAFDVGEERFRYVPVPPETSLGEESDTSRMVQIGQQIAIVDYHQVGEGISDAMTMWKLEDSLNGIWSHKRIVLPECFIRGNPILDSFCVTSVDGAEITLIPGLLYRNGYVAYYNIKEESTRAEVLSWLPQTQRDCNISCYYMLCKDVSVYVERLISLKDLYAGGLVFRFRF